MAYIALVIHNQNITFVRHRTVKNVHCMMRPQILFNDKFERMLDVLRKKDRACRQISQHRKPSACNTPLSLIFSRLSPKAVLLKNSGEYDVRITWKLNEALFSLDGEQRAWIGLHDKTTEGAWQWSDGLTYQPLEASSNADSRDCVALVGQHPGMWTARNCQEKSYFICKKN